MPSGRLPYHSIYNSEWEYYVKHGFGCMQESVVFEDWIERLPVTGLKAQFISITRQWKQEAGATVPQPSDKDFYVSIDPPFDSFTQAKLWDIGSTINLRFEPKPTKKSPNAKSLVEDVDEFADEAVKPQPKPEDKQPGPYWRGVVVDNTALRHPNAILLKVQRPWMAKPEFKILDDRAIPCARDFEVYDPNSPETLVYLTIDSKNNTVKTRLNALNKEFAGLIKAQPSKNSRKKKKNSDEDDFDQYELGAELHDAQDEHVHIENDPEVGPNKPDDTKVIQASVNVESASLSIPEKLEGDKSAEEVFGCEEMPRLYRLPLMLSRKTRWSKCVGF